jgi:hypothetical protein
MARKVNAIARRSSCSGEYRAGPFSGFAYRRTESFGEGLVSPESHGNTLRATTSRQLNIGYLS